MPSQIRFTKTDYQTMKGKLIQVTIDLSEEDYRDYANKAKDLTAKTDGRVSTASLIRHAMKKQKAEILSLKTI